MALRGGYCGKHLSMHRFCHPGDVFNGPGAGRWFGLRAAPEGVARVARLQVVEQPHLIGGDSFEAVIDEVQYGVGHRGQLAVDVVLVVDRAVPGLKRFRSVTGDQVADPARLPAQLAGRLHMGRYVALVLLKGAAQALSIDQLRIQFARLSCSTVWRM